MNAPVEDKKINPKIPPTSSTPFFKGGIKTLFNKEGRRTRGDFVVGEAGGIFARPESLLHFSGSKRLPLILQTETAECGLACLAMIAGFHGYETDLVSLRRRFSISSHGVTLKQLMDVAAKIHLAPRALRVEPEDLQHVTLPCVLHWGLNHFVVLNRIHEKALGKTQYVIHDPAFGERHFTAEEFNKHYTGVVLELTPTQEFKKVDERQTLKFSDFWSKISGLKRSLGQVILLSLLLQVFALASPFYMQTVVDDVLLRKDTNLLTVLAIGFGLLMLIQLGTSALRDFVVLHLSNRLGMQMSANLFRHLIRLPMDYFAKRHMGDIVSRFGSLNNVRSLLTNGMVTAVVDGLMAILTLIAMFFYSVKLAFIVMGVVAVYGLLRWALYRPFRALSEEAIIAGAKESSHFMESVHAIQTIKLFQKENDRQHQWQHKLADVMNKRIQLSRWNIGYTAINGFLFGVENILVIYFAATAVMGNLISLGMLYAFMSYKGRFISSVDNLIRQFIEFRMLDLHFNRLADIALTEPENIDTDGNIDDAYPIISDLSEATRQLGREQLLNNDFSDDLTHWQLITTEGAKANISLDTSELNTVKLTITEPGKERWNVQFIQNGLTVEKNQSYLVSFKVKSKIPTQFSAQIRLADEPWTVLHRQFGSSEAAWQEFSLSFTALESNSNLRLSFSGFGNQVGELYFCEISLKQVEIPNAMQGKITVKNLSYRYSEHEDYVFKDLNFTIEAGETVAIIGPSGCGKTTLLKCLMGLIEPTKGQILIDDKPLKHLPNYRRQIAGVMQEDRLMSGDVAENICCFSSEVNMKKIEQYARLACINADIEKMPMQYHTLVSDMGSNLSGGQKQRIILARALYREPRILFMDEATSHLDVTNEAIVNTHIQQLHITRVIVAHRPETVASAKRTISLTEKA